MFLTGCPGTEPPPNQGDADNDGVLNANDDCPNTPAGATVDDHGCPIVSNNDTDGDGVLNANDNCPNTPAGATVDANGCPVVSSTDADGDGVPNADDDCPDTPAGTTVDAAGCPVTVNLDTDGDGVLDENDDCPTTPAGVNVDETGCPVGDPNSGDADGDGVFDNVDQCANTPDNTDVDANGCPDSDGDGVADNTDQCPNTPAGEDVDATGCTVRPNPDQVCGNGDVEGTEQCDDGNTNGGDGCSANCRIETAGLGNDFCSDPMEVENGTVAFSNVGANTDGPDGGSACNFFSRTQVESDVWFCYTATCTGEASASLCGSEFDTKMAVYEGCGCPSTADGPLDCSDDDCGSGVENVQSRVAWQATQGQQYMIRIGGFLGEQGDGRLTIRCGGADVCGGSANDCAAESTDSTPGCSDAACCTSVCDVDQFCCDLDWDNFCADEAEGLCDGHFNSCAAGSGACGAANGSPGCATVSCCENVCSRDPYCCITEWDDNCASEAQAFCALSCGARAGDCFTAHDGAGCNSIPCCQLVCPEDPFCCDTEWDASCVSSAMSVCQQP